MDKEIQLIHEEFFKTFDKDLVDCYNVCLGKVCSKIFEFMRSNKFWRWLTRMNHASSIRIIRNKMGNIDTLYTMKEKDVLKIYRLIKSDDSLGEAIAFVVTYLVENGCPMEQIVAACTSEPLDEASMRSYCIDYDVPIFSAARKRVGIDITSKIEDCLIGLRVIITYCKWMKYDDPLILARIYLYATRVIENKQKSSKLR